MEIDAKDTSDLGDALGRHPTGLEGPSELRRRYRRRWVLVGAVTTSVIGVVAFLAFGLSRDPAALDAALIGRRAPDFDLATLDGGDRIHLSDLRGRVVVVNFWASWCAPCIDEHPDLSAAWNRFRDRGVVLVGILYQDTASNGLAFAERLGGDWPIVEDPDSSTALAYGIYGVPETFFIGPDGLVAHRQVGAVRFSDLSSRISALLRDAA